MVPRRVASPVSGGSASFAAEPEEVEELPPAPKEESKRISLSRGRVVNHKSTKEADPPFVPPTSSSVGQTEVPPVKHEDPPFIPPTSKTEEPAFVPPTRHEDPPFVPPTRHEDPPFVPPVQVREGSTDPPFKPPASPSSIMSSRGNVDPPFIPPTRQNNESSENVSEVTTHHNRFTSEPDTPTSPVGSELSRHGSGTSYRRGATKGPRGARPLISSGASNIPASLRPGGGSISSNTGLDIDPKDYQGKPKGHRVNASAFSHKSPSPSPGLSRSNSFTRTKEEPVDH